MPAKARLAEEALYEQVPALAPEKAQPCGTRAKRAGLWVDPEPTPPWEWRTMRARRDTQ